MQTAETVSPWWLAQFYGSALYHVERGQKSPSVALCGRSLRYAEGGEEIGSDDEAKRFVCEPANQRYLCTSCNRALRKALKLPAE